MKRITKRSHHTFVWYNHPIYQRWSSIHSRCNRPKDNDYFRYGGRGITVCDRWYNFENFVADMYPTYIEGLTIERRDNDGPYSPDNCYWITHRKQVKNKRNVNLFTVNGITETLPYWAKKYNIHYQTLYHRVINNGMDIEMALNKSVMGR